MQGMVWKEGVPATTVSTIVARLQQQRNVTNVLTLDYIILRLLRLPCPLMPTASRTYTSAMRMRGTGNEAAR